ncbi:MAG: hypothetical protein AYK18_18280 [Theionarchaea archaeon DG-70]|nr:MAG: hypothetical protein AYK18_18280 [Theionarchaea archaeon DG-70]
MISKFSDEELLELYHQGLTNREIAEKLGVSQPAVHYRIEKLGLTNNYHHDQDVNLQQVRILHGMGLTNVGIAVLLRTSVTVISGKMKELGLKNNYYKLRDLVIEGQSEVI